MRQYWETALPPFHTADGTAYGTSVTLTDVSPTPNITIGANQLEVGSEIQIRAYGQYSSAATAPTLLLGFYYGGIAGVALAASTAVTVTASAAAWPWELYWRGVVRS